VIRTTAEHPFYAYDKGWKSAADLLAGDWILTAAGDWRQVEELFATGVMEVVYNLRVADWHTYFVGDEDWGWAVWAHNAYIGSHGSLQGKEAAGFQRHHIGQDAALGSLPTVSGMPAYSPSAAPAIILWGGSGVPASAHDAATRFQRAENQKLLQSGATEMTLGQQAIIARGALVAAKNAPDQGGRLAITDADIDLAMAAFWTYITSLGHNGSTLVRIPSR